MSNILHESNRGIDIIPLADFMLSRNNVYITESICRESCNEAIKQLLYLNSQPNVDLISIYIDSDGGSVQSGLALYDVIRMLHKPVRTIILGQACSMAAVLFLAADTRLMLPNSRIMIHDPSFGAAHSISGLKSHEIQIELNELNKCREKIATIIAQRTGKSLKDIYKVTKNDTFYDSDEAIGFGLATAMFNLD